MALQRSWSTPDIGGLAAASTFLTDVTPEDPGELDVTCRPEEREWTERTLANVPKELEAGQTLQERRDAGIPTRKKAVFNSSLRARAKSLANLRKSASLPGPLRLEEMKKSLFQKSFEDNQGKSTSKAKDAIKHAKAFSQSKKSLKPALFEHKEDNYYQGMRVTPGMGWFRALCEQVSAHNCRLTRSLLAVLDVAIVDTLFIAESTKVFLRNSGSDLEVSVGDETVAEFAQHVQAWSKNIPEGCPVVVHKRSDGDTRQGCRNICTPMLLEEFNAALSKLSSEEDCVLFQRFIPPRTQSPSFVRVAWRDSLAPRGYRLKCSSKPVPGLIAGGKALTVLPEAEGANGWIVSSEMPGIHATELKSVPTAAFRFADQIAHFTTVVFGVQLSQLVVDCVQDEHGAYLLMQVKSFTAQPQWLRRLRESASLPTEDCTTELRGEPKSVASGPTVSRALRPQSAGESRRHGSSKKAVPTSICTMCTCSQPNTKMYKRMTPKMMLDTDNHLRKRGIQLFHSELVQALPLSDLTPVCDTCWSLYLAETQLMQAEERLAKASSMDMLGADGDEAYGPFGAARQAPAAPVAALPAIDDMRMTETASMVTLEPSSRHQLQLHNSASSVEASMLEGETTAFFDERVPTPEPAPEPPQSPSVVPSEVPAAVAAAVAVAVAEAPRLVTEAVADAVATVVAGVPAATAGQRQMEEDTCGICSCGNVFMVDSVFCRMCGERNPDAAVETCSCGSIFLPDSSFCRKCGARRPGH